MKENELIRFDYAAKNILRDKSNFSILEGLVSAVLGEDIHIEELLESESNPERKDDKFNRVDIKAKDSRGDFIIVEVQQTTQLFFMERILYGACKTVTEHMRIGDMYSNVKKVYSINIIYFELGYGADYIYHGMNTFIGVNTHDQLMLSPRERQGTIEGLPIDYNYPEYYLLRVMQYNKPVPETPIDEWFHYFRYGDIMPDTKVPGLKQAYQKLKILQMTVEEYRSYERYMLNQMDINESYNSAIYKGHQKGFEEGFGEGREKGMAEGRAIGQAIGQAEGQAIGRAEGREEGRKEGRKEGREEGREEERGRIASKLRSMGMRDLEIQQIIGD